MSQQTDLHSILSRELHTDELSLEHDTLVVSADVTKQVSLALSSAAQAAASGHTPVVELARASA